VQLYTCLQLYICVELWYHQCCRGIKSSMKVAIVMQHNRYMYAGYADIVPNGQ
jgi:hypothetical protein